MAGKILFHEKCNKDLDLIASRWNNKEGKGFHIWKGAMIRAYEDIFEFRLQAGKSFLHIESTSIENMNLFHSLKYFHLRHQVIAIVYYINKDQNIIVLSIQETGLANRERFRQIFNL